MRTLHFYLTRQMLATLGMTVFVFTLVLLLGDVVKEVLRLLINRQASLGLALHAIGLLIPWVLSFSLPIGMLTASLLVFGRFSSDQELTAARASGISLVSIISPVLLLSVFVSGICAWLNMEVSPACRMAYKELIYHAGVDRPADFLQSGQSTPVGNHIIYVGHRHPDKTNFDNIIIVEYGTNGEMAQLIQGATGSIVSDRTNHQIVLDLKAANTMEKMSAGWTPIQTSGASDSSITTIPFAPQAQQAMDFPPNNMTFRQLLDERDRVERGINVPAVTVKNKDDLLKVQKQLRAMSGDLTTPILVYLHREAAFSFACIGFTLIGIPLGIRSQRRETSVGVATALALMLIYYSFVVLAQAWSSHPERAPYLIVWLPNFLFQAVGAVLLWRANRGV